MKISLRHGAWLLLTLTAFLGMGCVERRFVVISDPPGAIVYDWKDEPRSAAPADMQFTYYGTYQFRLVKDGYESLVVQEKVRAPWYEWFLLDFVSENLVPFTFHDVRTFQYKMQPMAPANTEELLQKATELRGRGQSIGLPASALTGSPTNPPTVLPPGTLPGSPGGPPRMPPALQQ